MGFATLKSRWAKVSISEAGFCVLFDKIEVSFIRCCIELSLLCVVVW